MRVRRALEEAGQSYDVRLVSFKAIKQPAHLALHPFGQIPTYEAGGLALFESGAIVLHIAEHHRGTLLPAAADARARAIGWMFAALNTVEPPIVEHEQVAYLEADRPWYAARLPLLEERVRHRLGELSRRLGDAEWLDGAFSAGDLMMVMVLRRLNGSGLLDAFASTATFPGELNSRNWRLACSGLQRGMRRAGWREEHTLKTVLPQLLKPGNTLHLYRQ